jgi:putative RNA 2'-phosphotransferase
VTRKNPALQLAKMLAYILGRKPEEFGLVTDPEGFVKIKDLLKALGEEEELRFVRRGRLDEIVATMPDPPIEILDDRIRATDRIHLQPLTPAKELPKLLYTCVRRKAYPVVLEKGIFPANHPLVVLSSDRIMAERIGRRSDASPILLTISVKESREKQVHFLRAGGSLYLAEKIPPTCFTGPPPPKVQADTETREDREKKPSPKHAGSFFPDPADLKRVYIPDGRKRGGNQPDWKRDRKRRIRMERKKGPRF